MHVFRRGLYVHCLPETFEFLKFACDSLVNQTAIYTQYQIQGGVGGAGAPAGKAAPPAKGAGAGKGGDKALAATSAPMPALNPSPVDERLFLTLNETLASFLEAKGQAQEACAIATKACSIEPKTPPTTATTITAPYLRRRLCEIACQATARLSMGAGGGGGKGGAGASPAVAIATAINNLKFDSPFLTCYSCLTLGTN